MRKTFGEYMFFLLNAPFKKVQKSHNQFYIFFKVIGKLFDRCKSGVFQVREESCVISCSESMLPVHGQDRDMPRLEGETLSNYRTRLSMKGVIAEKAGSNEGIQYLARSFGYDNAVIEKNPDPKKWAEAEVTFVGGKIVIDNFNLLLRELNKIKPARTVLRLSKEQDYSTVLYFASAQIRGREMTICQE